MFFGSQGHSNRIIYSSINLVSFLPVIKTPNADQFHDLDASDSSQFQNSKFQESLTVKRWWYSFCHTITEISIAGNIHRLFRNEPSTTQGILLNWIQMHKQGMFTNLQYPWCAHETQTHPASARKDCAKIKKAAKLYEVDDNRAGSLQSSKIVSLPFSGDLPYALHIYALHISVPRVSWVSTVFLRTILFTNPQINFKSAVNHGKNILVNPLTQCAR